MNPLAAQFLTGVHIYSINAAPLFCEPRQLWPPLAVDVEMHGISEGGHKPVLLYGTGRVGIAENSILLLNITSDVRPNLKEIYDRHPEK